MMSDDNSSEHLHPTSRGSKRSSDDGTSSDASKPGMWHQHLVEKCKEVCGSNTAS
jgi:hypothetical protein